jgi:hypothetical protein
MDHEILQEGFDMVKKMLAQHNLPASREERRIDGFN